MSRAAVVRDQQHAQVEQNRKLADRRGVAGQIDTEPAGARALNFLCERAVIRKTNDRHGKSLRDQILRDPAEGRERPPADRDHSSSGGKEDEWSTGNRWMRTTKSFARRFELARPKPKRRNRRPPIDSAVDEPFRRRDRR